MSAHSTIVGGSTAKRVINCPGSVKLVQQAPPQPESKYAAEGSILHGYIERLVTDDTRIADLEINDAQAEKLDFCLQALDEIQIEEYDTEVKFKYDKVPGVFGTVDLIGTYNAGATAVVLDWKFGDGVTVRAEDNEQLMFYALLAWRSGHWAFEKATEVELCIVQPPQLRQWSCSLKRLARFEDDLLHALRIAQGSAPPTAIGEWCKFCPAKTICPQHTGAIERVVRSRLEQLSNEQLGQMLELADKLESFIGAARGLVQQKLEAGLPVPGWKLVPKQARRQWTNEADALAALRAVGAPESELMELRSPAQIEKVLKKRKIALPEEVVTSVSSGDTIAPESDPRPAKVLLAQQFAAALSKI